jgi:hypothetical protein
VLPHLYPHKTIDFIIIVHSPLCIALLAYIFFKYFWFCSKLGTLFWGNNKDTGRYGACSGIVVKALCYKPAGRKFDSRWCHWNFSGSFWSHYGPGVDSASNRNEYQVYFLGVKDAGA